MAVESWLKTRSKRENYLFIGLGSIGQRHLSNLRQIDPYQNVTAYRTNQTNISELNKKYNITSYTDIDIALSQNPKAVFITNPTSLHMKYALKAAKCNCHLFIEKPISTDSRNIDKLFAIMKKNDKVCFVAFNYRFHPYLQIIKQIIDQDALGKVVLAKIEVGQLLPTWHDDENYQFGYAARKELGGGVLLTLIHEIDYAQWLFGDLKLQSAHVDKISSLKINVEDYVSFIAKANDAIVEVHMDYLQHPPKRTCEILFEKGKIIWDYYENTLKIYQNKHNQWSTLKYQFNRNDMYLDELQHFINCTKKIEEPLITRDEIKKVMLLVEKIRNA